MKNILKIKNKKQIEEITNQIVSPTSNMMMMMMESFPELRLFLLSNPHCCWNFKL